MIWVDLLVGALALVVLGLVGYRLYRHVRTLMRAVSDSSTTIANASVDLNAQQAKAAARG